MAQVNNLSAKLEFLSKIRKLIKGARHAKVDYKLMHSFEKKIKNVTLESIEKRVEKHSNNPLRLKRYLKPTIVAYMKNLSGYLIEQNKLWGSLEPLAVELDRVEYEDLVDVNKIVDRWIARVHDRHGGSIFTDKMIKKLNDHHKDYFHHIQKELRKDYLTQKREMRGGRPKGVFLHWKSDSSLFRELLRLSRKAKRADAKFTHEKDALMDQLKSTVELNFIDLFDRYLDDEGKLDHILMRMKKDIEEEAYRLVHEEQDLIKQSNSIISLIIHNYPQIVKHVPHFDELTKLIHDNNRYSDMLMKMAKTEMRDDRALAHNSKNEQHKFVSLVSDLHSISASRHLDPVKK